MAASSHAAVPVNPFINGARIEGPACLSVSITTSYPSGWPAAGPPVPRAEVGRGPRDARVASPDAYHPDGRGERERQPAGDPGRLRLGRFRVAHRSRLR